MKPFILSITVHVLCEGMWAVALYVEGGGTPHQLLIYWSLLQRTKKLRKFWIPYCRSKHLGLTRAANREQWSLLLTIGARQSSSDAATHCLIFIKDPSPFRALKILVSWDCGTVFGESIWPCWVSVEGRKYALLRRSALRNYLTSSERDSSLVHLSLSFRQELLEEWEAWLELLCLKGIFST